MIKRAWNRLQSYTCSVYRKSQETLRKWFDNSMINEQSFEISKEELKYWKNQIFYITIAVVLIFGAPLILYGSYIFYSSGEIGFALIEVLFYVATATIILNKKISINFKKQFTIFILYSISLFLIITASIMGSGMISVIFTIVLSGCILDKKQIVNFLVGNLITFMVITILLYNGGFDGTSVELYKDVWIINAATAQAFSIILLMLINSVYNGLENQAKLIKLSKASLAASEIKHKEMITNISDALFIVTHDGVVSYHSPNLHVRFPWMSKDLLGNSLFEEFHPEDREYINSIFLSLKEAFGQSKTIDVRYLVNNEPGYLEMTALNLIEDENIKGILINCRDITERRIREEEIMYLYQHDHLTGLYNRASFEIELKRLDNRRYLPLSVIVGDINGLKMINDSLGHAEGDKLLISMSKILERCSRDEDIVTRLGGDEYILLLPHTSMEVATELIQKIYDTCEEYNQKISGEIYHISISLGAATKVDDNENINNVIKVAEDHMYKRKLLEGRSYHSSIIASIKTALFEKSYETEQHAHRLIHLSREIGEVICLTSQQFDDLELFSTLHDIGKIGIDNQILNKPDKLTDAEWVLMKKHSDIGYRIAMASPELLSIAYYILTHHERWDGTGYPQGLAGEKIPLLSRILSVVDAYDAMTEDRPYRNGMSKQEAVKEIIRCSGTQFDPEIAKIFIGIITNDDTLLFTAI